MRRLLALAAFACACSAALAQEEPPAAQTTSVDAVRQTGIASWYGKRFHGRRTASGETFDMDALTAAHPWLPFGTWVRVRDLVNGRSVDVRINDRGPHSRRRVIDLSRAAARSLGVAGTHQVEISLLEKQAP